MPLLRDFLKQLPDISEKIFKPLVPSTKVSPLLTFLLLCYIPRDNKFSVPLWGAPAPGETPMDDSPLPVTDASPPLKMNVYQGQDGLYYKAIAPKSFNDCWLQFPSPEMLAVLPDNGKGFNSEYIVHATTCLKQGLLNEDFFKTGFKTGDSPNA